MPAPVDLQASAVARERPLPVGAARLTGGFWAQRRAASCAAGLPRLVDRLDAHGVLDNFRAGVDRRGLWFTDSDLYKWLEGAAWSLTTDPDPVLRARVDEAVTTITGAAGSDGYLDTAFPDPAQRFTQLGWSHELYCLGHLIQAAIALDRGLGDGRLLTAAVAFADHVDDRLGPASGRTDTDLHPGVETALVELARHTGDDRYRALAAALVDRVDLGDPVEFAGHAVRAAYFATGIADLVLDGAIDRRPTLDALWSSMVERKAYVTGGIGGRWIGESVGRDYELPAEGAYAETCGAVAVVHWAWRMLLLTGDAQYADHLEWTLGNGFLAGVALAGDEWFYANPLAASGVGDHDPWDNDRLAIGMAGPFPLARRPWRDVTCCPPNAVRMLASLPGYLAAESPGALTIHLYADAELAGGGLRCRVESGLPWEGRVTVTVTAAPAEGAILRLRIPAWSDGARLDGAAVTPGFAEVTVRTGDRVDLELPMPVRRLAAHPRLADARGAVALARGPLLYCVESVDNPDVDLLAVALDRAAPVAEEWAPGRLGGVVTLRVRGTEVVGPLPLYRSADAPVEERAVELVAIPYFAWANRGPSAMTVWMR